MTNSEQPRIVFIGAERVGFACLERLHRMGKNVVSIVTAEDRLREKIADWVSFDEFANETGVPLHKVRTTKRAESVDLVNSMKPDLICVASWSYIIPPEMLELPTIGTIGFHYSMLPKRRGGAPLNWAIIDGLKETGITLFYMDEGIDSGDVIAQRAFPIDESDTVKELLDKIEVIAPDLLAENIDGIENGTANRIRQDESLATYTTRRRPEDGEIDWSKTEREIYDFVRALAPPYPCAFTTVGERRMVVPSARMENGRLKIEAYFE